VGQAAKQKTHVCSTAHVECQASTHPAQHACGQQLNLGVTQVHQQPAKVCTQVQHEDSPSRLMFGMYMHFNFLGHHHTITQFVTCAWLTPVKCPPKNVQ
jgi:hypothetical protein